MLILRDIGFRRIDRFNGLIESVPGLTPRVPSMRLKELEQEGYIECIENQKSPIIVRWTLTQKGSETLPISVSVPNGTQMKSFYLYIVDSMKVLRYRRERIDSLKCSRRVNRSAGAVVYRARSRILTACEGERPATMA